jgi:methyl-accepting chemotaxis protein
MNKMTLGFKISTGFGLLILIILLLGGLAEFKMEDVSGESTKLATEFVPQVKVATDIGAAANQVMYAMRGYGLSEDEKYYQQALKALESMDQALAQGGALAAKALHLDQLGGELDKIKAALAEYKKAVESTKASIARLKGFRQELNNNAAAYMAASAEFLDSQNQAFEKEMNLRLQRLTLVNQLVDMGTKVRVMNFKAQALNDPGLMVDAINELQALNGVTRKLREVTPDVEDLSLIGKTEGAAEGYLGAMAKFFRQFRKGDRADTEVLQAARKDMDENANVFVTNCAEFFKGQRQKLSKGLLERKQKMNLANQVIELGNAARLNTYKAQALGQQDLILEAQKNFPKISLKLSEIRAITKLQADLDLIGKVEKAAQGYSMAMSSFLNEWGMQKALDKEREGLSAAMLAVCNRLSAAGNGASIEVATNTMQELDNSSFIMLAGLVAALLLGILLAVFITRSITKPVRRVIDGLTQGSEQVSSAAAEVSNASQSLASGASQQAASLEETSSSLEEMASMTRQNADNASQADHLMSGGLQGGGPGQQAP